MTSLGISSTEPLYVVQVDAKHNRVVVGASDDLLKKEMTVGRVNWIAIAELSEPIRVAVKIRSRAEEAGALLTQQSDGSVIVTFDEPQRAVTPGQAAVFYDGDIVCVFKRSGSRSVAVPGDEMANDRAVSGRANCRGSRHRFAAKRVLYRRQ